MTREELNQEIQDEIFKEEHKEFRKKLIKNIIKWVFILAVVFFLFYLYVINFSTIGFIIKENRIINEKIPDDYNELKVVKFSDFH